jgi:hypothetical protein
MALPATNGFSAATTSRVPDMLQYYLPGVLALRMDRKVNADKLFTSTGNSRRPSPPTRGPTSGRHHTAPYS